MRIIDCKQGGADWFAARLGIPTASQFHRFLTPLGVARKGEMPRAYALELVAERLTGLPAEHYVTDAMQAGIELEPRARSYYALTTGRDVRQTGIMLSDDGLCGASPDGICEDRGLEIKCPRIPAFMRVADSLVLPDEHLLQVQAGLWISGLPAWDYLMFTATPGLEPQIITVAPDHELHARFSDAVPAFCDAVAEIEARLRERGHGHIAAVRDDGPTWDELIDGRSVV